MVQRDPAEYPQGLSGRTIESASRHGGMVEVALGGLSLVFAEGCNLRYYPDQTRLPAKHQLLLLFDDGSCLCTSVRMYGFILCFEEGSATNDHYIVARDRPSPLTRAFSPSYFEELMDGEKSRGLNVKAFLATEQRIPGLGNGVLQDILLNARIHPRTGLHTRSAAEGQLLYDSIQSTLQEMVDGGGRDTETDLFGRPAGYRTTANRKTVGTPCPVCGTAIEKERLGGGSVYVCPHYQTC